MIEMNCPHCDHTLRIPDKYAGRRGGCKHCRGTFRVPKTIPTPPPREPEQTQEPAAAAPASMSNLDNMDDMPALDPEFADRVTGEEVPEPSTKLSDLDDDDPAGAEAPASARRPRAAQVPGDEGLGCLFWGTVFFIPPAGLVWSFFVPSGHPAKVRAIVSSVLFCLLAGACIALGGSVGFDVQGLDTGGEFAQVSQGDSTTPTPPPPQNAAVTSQPAASPETTPSFQRGGAADGSGQSAFQPPQQQGAAGGAATLANLSITYPGLTLTAPQRLTPAMIGDLLGFEHDDYDVRGIAFREGVAANATLEQVSQAIGQQLMEQGFQPDTSFGGSTKLGPYQKVSCEAGADEWFLARVTNAPSGGTKVVIALHTANSGSGLTLPQYQNDQQDPVPFIQGISLQPAQSVTADMLDSLDDNLASYDVRNLVIREANVNASFEEVANSYQAQFRQMGWDSRMAYGMGSRSYRAVKALWNGTTVEIQVEDLGEGQSRVVAVSPLQ